MAKRNRAKAKVRREQHEKSKRQQNLFIAAGVVIAAIIGVVVFLNGNSSGGSSAGAVSEERMRLDPFEGAEDAPITLIEYGAYGCTACKAWHDARIVEQLMQEFPGQIKFIFRDMPIILPPYSLRAAEVAECAHDQGNEAFWTMHHAIYDEAAFGRASQEDIIQIGERHGLDGDALRECVQSDKHMQTVRFDQQRGFELGINSTPTWFVNDERIFRASPDILRNLIRDELNRING